jgi:hypothetical protein
MANTNAKHDDNYVPTALFAQSSAPSFVSPGQIDQLTGRILVDASGSSMLISTGMQKDVFSSTNGQTTFIPSKTLVFDFFISVNGSVQTPSTDYSIVGGSYVLNSGIPSGCAVILLYSIT